MLPGGQGEGLVAKGSAYFFLQVLSFLHAAAVEADNMMSTFIYYYLFLQLSLGLLSQHNYSHVLVSIVVGCRV